MRRRIRWSALTAAMLLALALPAQAQDLGTDAQREDGKQLYDKFCSQCHGDTGAGDGDATGRVKPAPRDFTSGKYKFRTTPSGAMPTDADLMRVLKQGLPYTSMPAWPNLSDTQLQNIIYYLKTFSEDFSNADKLSDPIDIPTPPEITEESITRGRTVYEAQGCAACHGDQGRGDGLSAPTLSDDWGDHLRPADMTMPWTYRGGATREDVFRTFSTGLNGTPMPSYGDTLPVEERWDLVNYIYALSDAETPNYSELLVVDYVEDELNLASEELFAEAQMSRFPLFGQIVEPGRNFFPSATSVRVEAVHNKKDIAFRVRWNDMRAEVAGNNDPTLAVPLWEEENPKPESGGADGGDEDEGGFWGEEVEEDDGGDFWGEEEDTGGDFWGEEEAGGATTPDTEFSDAVALQFPSRPVSGIRKPYFIFGDTQNSVDLWFVDLARKLPQTFVGRGSDGIEAAEGDDIEVITSYEAGEWTVLLKREQRSSSGISFGMDQFTPIAFSVWDGFNRERGNKRALSAWFHLYVEPDQEVSPVGPMVRTALIVLLLEIIAIVIIRRKYAAGGVPAGEDEKLSGRRATA
ncbi:MAG: c-type cytochrome [bacterium]|nr:c-type cytochrome [bacterium]